MGQCLRGPGALAVVWGMDASICPMETSMKATGETLNTGSESICKTGSGWEFDVADCFLWLWYLAQVTSVPTLEEQQQKRVFTTFSRIQVKLEAIKDDIDKLTFGGEGDNDLRDFKKVEDSDATYEGEWLNGKKRRLRPTALEVRGYLQWPVEEQLPVRLGQEHLG
mmetsp:Transcript_1744/g.3703  ORF Transcript_1744/g.3703 Transcript_1744/m.3703 type:complete len:166 (+) Transcript_1744:140-637(+)